METPIVSIKLLKRLPVYLHYIKTLPEHTENISATRMAKDLGLGDVMVRKDLAKVSNGGRRKLGYVREDLIVDIEKFLDFNSTTDAIVIGAGNWDRHCWTTAALKQADCILWRASISIHRKSIPMAENRFIR